MLPSLDIGRGITQTTAFRLLAFFTIVLAPIGLIAVFQTQQLNHQLRAQAHATRLAAVIEAAQTQRVVIDRAVGAAEILGDLSRDLPPNGEDCHTLFEQAVNKAESYRFAGLLPRDGRVVCSSVESDLDLSDDPDLERSFETPGIFADGTPSGRGSEEAVIIVGVPVYDDAGEIMHYATLSLAQASVLPKDVEDSVFDNAEAIAIFNARGEVLLSLKDSATIAERLPSDTSLTALAGGEPTIFSREDALGRPRVFSIVPLYEDVIYLLATWPPEEVLEDFDRGVPAWLFPIFMWLATLAVAYIAVNRLVLRHTKVLGLRMRRFALNRRLPDLAPRADQPSEFLEMDRIFRDMAESILKDEAQLENTVREKNVLLREVHHRVKNNLQLIASIMNMQIRKNRNTETGVVVRRLQDRVLSLAAVHQKIYQAEVLSRIDMIELLEDILQKTLYIGLPGSGGVRIDTDFDQIQLHPDQAVPLALLMAEASTNAVRYMGRAGDAEPFVTIRVKKLSDCDVEFTFVNSVGDPLSDAPRPTAATTLGTQLIRAYSMQLGGTLEIDEGETEYRLSLVFPIARYDATDIADGPPEPSVEQKAAAAT